MERGDSRRRRECCWLEIKRKRKGHFNKRPSSRPPLTQVPQFTPTSHKHPSSRPPLTQAPQLTPTSHTNTPAHNHHSHKHPSTHPHKHPSTCSLPTQAPQHTHTAHRPHKLRGSSPPASLCPHPSWVSCPSHSTHSSSCGSTRRLHHRKLVSPRSHD